MIDPYGLYYYQQSSELWSYYLVINRTWVYSFGATFHDPYGLYMWPKSTISHFDHFLGRLFVCFFGKYFYFKVYTGPKPKLPLTETSVTLGFYVKQISYS